MYTPVNIWQTYEVDLGITLFEANANFDSFTKVEKDQNGTVKRTNCN
mgnify:CR=1 FL=1